MMQRGRCDFDDPLFRPVKKLPTLTALDYCPDCKRTLATDADPVTLCARCWDLLVELPMMHGSRCGAPACQRPYHARRRALYRKWGVA